MPQEMTSEKQSQASASLPLRPPWRALAVQQWLLQAQARLEIQSALASRAQNYVSQLRKRITESQTWVQEQLAAQGPPGERTQSSGKLQSAVFNIMDELVREGKPVTAQSLNSALTEHGMNPLSRAEAGGYVTYHNLMKN
jgi:hypothetical protein